MLSFAEREAARSRPPDEVPFTLVLMGGAAGAMIRVELFHEEIGTGNVKDSSL